MEEYNNILDFFRFVRKQDLCTTPYCTTCGAMEFRKLCQLIGRQKIKELLEATSYEDLEKCHVDLWYNPLKTMIIDGFYCEPDSPIMLQYEKGYQQLVYGSVTEEIMVVNEVRIMSLLGSIFDVKNVDVLALYENPGLADLPFRIRKFLSDNDFPHEQSTLLPCNGKQGDVKFIYYKNTRETNGRVNGVESILKTMLNSISAKGLTSLAMNGIRTQGHSERDNLRIIRDWALENPDTTIKSIILVDKRGGFTRLEIGEYLKYGNL